MVFQRLLSRSSDHHYANLYSESDFFSLTYIGITCSLKTFLDHLFIYLCNLLSTFASSILLLKSLILSFTQEFSILHQAVRRFQLQYIYFSSSLYSRR